MALAVLLAAGGGTRFRGGDHKLRSVLRGRAVLAHALDAVVASGLEAVVVVGSLDVSDLVPEGVALVPNPAWEAGQATSVRAGIAEARRRGHDAVVVGLGDQPFVPAAAWARVAAATEPVAVATYAGRRGHPVRLAAEVWDLLPPDGDEVGRALMRSRPELVREIPCDDGGGTGLERTDIDTVEDLRRWS